MNCLWCDENIVLQTNWSNFLFPPKRGSLCQTCMNQLEYLSGSRCAYCSRQAKRRLCSDCQQWKEAGADSLQLNYSLFNYNDIMKDMIAKWKYRGDYILGNAFRQPFRQAFKSIFSKYKHDYIVPIPLSEERLLERGFNQAEMLASFITSTPKQVLVRMHSEKQSKKTRQERLTAKNPFEIKEQLNKPVILVDDIYTTGITLRHAAHTLKQAGCPRVSSLTLIRG